MNIDVPAEVTLTLTKQQVETIILSLAKQPYEVVAPVIDAIATQIKPKPSE